MKIKKKLKYKSAFDIIGPIMIGPSSSHTAGAVKIGKLARDLFNEMPTKLSVTFYGSFAETYKGHGTAVAIVGGVLGYETSDERIREAITFATEAGIEIEFLVSRQEVPHANTANLVLTSGEDKLDLTAISIGGGSIQLTELNGYSITESNLTSSIVVITDDQEKTTNMLAENLNATTIKMIQKNHGKKILYLETSDELNEKNLLEIRTLPGILNAFLTTY